jgi:hypothetical protein
MAVIVFPEALQGEQLVVCLHEPAVARDPELLVMEETKAGPNPTQSYLSSTESHPMGKVLPSQSFDQNTFFHQFLVKISTIRSRTLESHRASKIIRSSLRSSALLSKG